MNSVKPYKLKQYFRCTILIFIFFDWTFALNFICLYFMDIVLVVQKQWMWDSAVSLDKVNYRHNIVDSKHCRIPGDNDPAS